MIATDPRSRSLTTPKNPFTRPLRPTDPFGVSSGHYQPIGPRLAALAPAAPRPSAATGLGSPESVGGYILRPDQVAFRNSLDPLVRGSWDSDFVEQRQAEARNLAARNAALGTLGDSRTRLQGELDRYRSDPRAAYIGGEFERMSRPDYEAIGQAQQAAGRLTIGQAYAHAMDQAGRSAAASGTYASPTTGSREAYLSSLAAGQTATFNANVEGQNAAARNEALRNLSAFNETRDRYGLALDDAISRMDSELARAQADVNYVPTDYTPFAELQYQHQRATEEQATQEQRWQEYLDSQKFDGADLARLFGDLRGSGLFKLLGG